MPRRARRSVSGGTRLLVDSDMNDPPDTSIPAGRPFARVGPTPQSSRPLCPRVQRLDSTITAWVERHCAYAILWSAGVRKQLLWIGDFRAQYTNEPEKGILIPDPVEVAATSVGAEPVISK